VWLILLTLAWLAVTVTVVAACRATSKADHLAARRSRHGGPRHRDGLRHVYGRR